MLNTLRYERQVLQHTGALRYQADITPHWNRRIIDRHSHSSRSLGGAAKPNWRATLPFVDLESVFKCAAGNPVILKSDAPRTLTIHAIFATYFQRTHASVHFESPPGLALQPGIGGRAGGLAAVNNSCRGTVFNRAFRGWLSQISFLPITHRVIDHWKTQAISVQAAAGHRLHAS
jgi:hypothetical protein